MDIIKIIDRVKTHLGNRTTDIALGPSKKKSEYYRSSSRFQNELQSIFHKLPLIAGFSVQLPNLGDFFTLDDYQIPLIIVRGQDGQVKAFANQCRHRGSKIALQKRGNAHCFSCPYHAWTYNTDGTLRGMPHPKGFAHLDPADLGLFTHAVWEQDGIIWFNYQMNKCAPGGESSSSGFEDEVRQHLGPVGDDLRMLNLSQTRFSDMNEEICNANWKVLIEAFLEGYHIQMTHKNTLAPGVFDNLSLHDTMGNHSRSFYPLKKLKKYIENPTPPEKLRSGLSGIYHLFPNTILAIEPFQFSILQFIPIELNRSRARMTTLSHSQDDQAQEKFRIERELLKAGVKEDIQIAESIQVNLDSGRQFDLEFGLFEGMISHFHSVIDKIEK